MPLMFETDNTEFESTAPKGESVVSGNPETSSEHASAPQEEPQKEAGKKDWYILKVQVNREDAIKDAIFRRAAVSGLSDYFERILVPTEKVTEFRNGKKRVVKKKLYPGYLMIYMEITEETYFMVRETSGVGDFAGASGKPSSMPAHEVERILESENEVVTDAQPKLKIPYRIGDKIKVKDGNFENFEGEVHQIDASNGHVIVMLTIFGRSTPVELEYWQIEHPD